VRQQRHAGICAGGEEQSSSLPRPSAPCNKTHEVSSRAGAGMPTIERGETSTTKKPAELASDGFVSG
jgi:hypothetical protein